jgi:hypothetical protein
MAKTVTRTFDYRKFSCSTNKWYSELKDYTRPMSKQEEKIVRKYNMLIACALFSIPLILITSIVYGLLIPNLLWGLLLIPFVMGATCLFLHLLHKAWALEDIIRHFNDYGFDTEKLIWEGELERQKEICNAWRAQHPFEEAIRKAQESNSSVDIAAAARLYAEQYINK